jgi:hypothetical protein
MARLAGDFDANLAAAAGEDPALLAELRQAFAQSFAQQLDLLTRARCDGNWEIAAQRLKTLGASFHVGDLADLADEALESAPGDPRVLRKLAALCQRFAAGGEA